MKLSELDSNFKLETNIEREGLVFKDIDEQPFKIYGVYRDGECYRRMPRSVAECSVQGTVEDLARHTSGGRVRFVTDSPYIAVKLVLPDCIAYPHLTYECSTGVDMYTNDGGGDRFRKAFLPPMDMKGGYEGVYDFGEGEPIRTVTLNMPLYNGVYRMYVGLKEGSTLLPPPDYALEKPIVYYGSSITQGGCASRPGACYQAIIARRLDANFINLGFSGSARGEIPIAEYIASLDMSMFVLDYDHNAPTPEELLATHKPFFDVIRAKNPTLPIIIMPKPRYYRGEIESRRAGIVRATYEAAIANGDENVYFIDGPALMSEVLDDGTVDTVHPTDAGFRSMANAIAPVIRRVLNLK